MATAATRGTLPLTRRPLSSSGPSSSSTNSITRGATARSAVSSRASTLNGAAPRRTAPLKATSAPTPVILNEEENEALIASLRAETEQKEQLLVQLQNKDQTITNLFEEHGNLTLALSSAESRVNELYADQSRMEDEMATRIELVEKLRSQVHELEKEKREILRRYNEQTATFDAERQAFYDNEQHLKSRIQSLMQARKQPELAASMNEPEEDTQLEDDAHLQQSYISNQVPKEPETEPAEMTALRLELSTLSTSYNSLQSTLVLLQTQLIDLKRVNHELQEENESYMILLRERTLSGRFDVMKQMGGNAPSDGEDDDDDVTSNVGSFRSAGKPMLESVLETAEETAEETLEQGGDLSLQTPDSHSPTRNTRYPNRHVHKRPDSTSPSSSIPHGESLADLPITGPGLDLAAELGRAENKDILEGVIDDRDRPILGGKPKRDKKQPVDKRVSADPSDIDALRNEVKSLKDANKALSLYASKIIDRIISEEGFEHVLAVDYEKQPTSAQPSTGRSNTLPLGSPGLSPVPAKKQRPQSIMPYRPPWNPPDKIPERAEPLHAQGVPSTPNPKRRSLSIDWKGFVFGGSEKKEVPNLRPLTLRPGANPIVGARKLDNIEDEEDRRERDRLHATMKLMGIQPQKSLPSPASTVAMPLVRSFSTSGASDTTTVPSRFSLSLFRSSSIANSETSSMHSVPSIHSAPPTHGEGVNVNLTQEALERAEAENKLALLDAHERALSVEIGKGSSGGFTEISPRGAEGRRSRRSRRSGGGSSGSTVWSAGMSGEAEE